MGLLAIIRCIFIYSIALGMFAFFAYKKILRDNDEIKLILKTGEKEYNTHLTLLRKDCTRAEIMGLLGMIQKDPSKRFHIEYLQKSDFLKKLHHVQKGKDKRVIVMMRGEEKEQFIQTSKNGSGKKL